MTDLVRGLKDGVRSGLAGSDASSAFVRVEGLSKAFGRRDEARVHALRGATVSVARGEMLVLLGHSGSGKTTLLRCVAGLEQPDSGWISIADQTVYSTNPPANVPTERRNLGVVFQSYGLWPHMTVADNVEYPLKRRSMSAAERGQKVDRYLEIVGCRDLMRRYPHELSGGQQQRIAVARALVYEPSVMLFDEPLSNLDAVLRERLRYEFRELQKNLGFTGIYVTHDQAEAFYLGHRIAVMAHGEILQIGQPSSIYTEPSSMAVAEFIGASNLLRGNVTVESTGMCRLVAESGLLLDLSGTRFARSPRPGMALLMVCPETTKLVDPGKGLVEAGVVDRVDLGRSIEYKANLAPGKDWRIICDRASATWSIGDRASILVGPEALHVFPVEAES